MKITFSFNFEEINTIWWNKYGSTKKASSMREGMCKWLEDNGLCRNDEINNDSCEGCPFFNFSSEYDLFMIKSVSKAVLENFGFIDESLENNDE